jgi:hypothetical protein
MQFSKSNRNSELIGLFSIFASAGYGSSVPLLKGISVIAIIYLALLVINYLNSRMIFIMIKLITVKLFGSKNVNIVPESKHKYVIVFSGIIVASFWLLVSMNPRIKTSMNVFGLNLFVLSALVLTLRIFYSIDREMRKNLSVNSLKMSEDSDCAEPHTESILVFDSMVADLEFVNDAELEKQLKKDWLPGLIWLAISDPVTAVKTATQRFRTR